MRKILENKYLLNCNKEQAYMIDNIINGNGFKG